MKVLHIVSGDLNGGAARGACWLHQELIKQGVDSVLYTNSRFTYSAQNVVTTSNSRSGLAGNALRIQIEKLLSCIYVNREKKVFSTGMVGKNFTKTKEYKNADIIHLHWINTGFVDIKVLSKINKPIVWTLRDMWPMTGGCHCPMDCDNYKTGCGNCKQLGSNSKYDLSRFILWRKKKYFPKNMCIVGISNWVSENARESEVFRKFDIRTIHNGINAKDFFPIEKNVAKKVLGLNTKKQIILTGSTNANQIWKGFGKFLEAVEALDKNRYCLCFFGNQNKDIACKLGFEVHEFGFLNDAVSLRLAYSAADVFVAPSVMEAFGKTIVESMACGTPVVCFDATGPKDIVTHKIDGYKAEPFSSKDLAAGIEWILKNENYQELANRSMEKFKQKFDIKVIAKQYISLYEEILNE